MITPISWGIFIFSFNQILEIIIQNLEIQIIIVIPEIIIQNLVVLVIQLQVILDQAIVHLHQDHLFKEVVVEVPQEAVLLLEVANQVDNIFLNK